MKRTLLETRTWDKNNPNRVAKIYETDLWEFTVQLFINKDQVVGKLKIYKSFLLAKIYCNKHLTEV